MDRKEIRYDLQQAMPIIEIIYTVLKEHNNIFLNKLRENKRNKILQVLI